jgi:hypothetical protein
MTRCNVRRELAHMVFTVAIAVAPTMPDLSRASFEKAQNSRRARVHDWLCELACWIQGEP